MKISIFGTGYVGLVTGVCFADLGNDVICCDIDREKIRILKMRKVPFCEPQVGELIEKNLKDGRINFTTDYKEALKDTEVIFITVGTPQQKNGRVDLSYVKDAAKEIGKNLRNYAVVVNKSTVPIGTGKLVRNIIAKKTKNNFDMVSNPEFLREGSAVRDFMTPERVVIGSESAVARDIMNKLYESMDCPIINTNIETAEMIKYASNAFLATKISFINEIANICENVGANIDEISHAMGLDSRIGNKFLNAGVGYGGSCFPKDVKALHNMALHNGYNFELLKSVIKVNNNQRLALVKKAERLLGNLKKKRISVWGLSFKPNTDDIRESSAIDIIRLLQKRGAEINVYDPKVNYDLLNKNEKIKKPLNYFSDKYNALKDCDAMMIATEWDEFKKPDFAAIKKALKNPIIFDGRNIYPLSEMKGLGFKYISIGRPDIC